MTVRDSARAQRKYKSSALRIMIEKNHPPAQCEYAIFSLHMPGGSCRSCPMTVSILLLGSVTRALYGREDKRTVDTFCHACKQETALAMSTN